VGYWVIELLGYWVIGLLGVGEIQVMRYRFRNEEKERLAAVRRYIETNADAVLRVDALCRMALMNRHKLNEGFQRFYGQKVRAFVLTLRMEKGRELLQTTEDSIEMIAMNCGYSHASNFGVVYKRYFGYAPKEERNKQGSTEPAADTGV
jgi:AraC family transcriptional regulator, transcriptional activator of the genes for pyochelin and ferripyochelin receptors